MAVLEAMGCGTPALIARAPTSATPALALGEEFLFAPGDATDLASRLDRLLDVPARLEAARARCLALAPAYALQASVDQLEALLTRVAVRREGAARDARARGRPAAP